MLGIIEGNIIVETWQIQYNYESDAIVIKFCSTMIADVTLQV